jgi:hypothetical protein
LSTEDFQLSCDDVRRRQDLEAYNRRGNSLNGIDYLEVIPPEATGGIPLLVVFLYVGLPSPNSLTPKNFTITGGTRTTNIGVEWVQRFVDLSAPLSALVRSNVTVLDPGATNVVVVKPTSDGDFSTYTLWIVDAADPSQPPANFDTLLSRTTFGFKVECPQNFDCNPTKVCPTEFLEPVIDYLAKDFNSFNTLMLNRLSLINPTWQERHPADMGVALVELLAYVGDQLSYYQDAVATEAYLGTARRRISIRRHARLLDYFMHDGCNSRAWVTMKIDPSVDGLVVPMGTGLLTGSKGDSTVITGDLDRALVGAMVFETMADVALYSSHNDIQFYTWHEEDCCLPLGGTAVTLRNDNNALDRKAFALTGVSGLGTGGAEGDLVAAMAAASTTTSGTSTSDQNVLTVASTVGFSAGDVVVISPGNPDQESAVVSYVQGTTLVLKSNLGTSHPADPLVPEAVYSVPLATYLLDNYGADWVLGARYAINSGPTGQSTTGTTSTVLQDSGATWTTGEWAGDYLEYNSGPAEGQSRRIVSNTPTSIATDPGSPFSPSPSGANDSFSIVTENVTITVSDGVHSASVVFEVPPPATSVPETASFTVDGKAGDELVIPPPASGQLRFMAHTLRIGDVLIFEEVRSPTTGRVADADPSHRCAVRLTGVTARTDPLDPTPLLDVSWDAADAPPFPLCLEDVDDPDHGNLPLPASMAHGNVVLADNGQTRRLGTLPLVAAANGESAPGGTPNVLEVASPMWVVNQWVGYQLEYTSGPAEGQSLLIASNTEDSIATAVAFSPAPTPGGGDSFTISSPEYANAQGNFFIGYTEFLGNTPGGDAETDTGGRFLPGLSYQPLTFAAPFDPKLPASSAFEYDVRTALPSVTVFGQGQVWTPVRDLLSSGAFDYEFVTEVDNDGTAYLRFGDGTLGNAPSPSTIQDPNPFYAIYRMGNGISGNVGREAISRVVNASVYGEAVQSEEPFIGTGILSVRNPMEAQGGTDPEPVEDVREFAPYAFDSQERAVVTQDYEGVLAKYPGVEQGYAQLKWTGSWWTWYVSVDRTAGLAVDPAFKARVETYLNSYRMAGYDLEITDPVFVPLDIEMHVCAAPGFNPDTVRKALLDAFSNGVLPDGTKGFFYPDNFRFGQTVFLSTVYATATKVAGVSSVVVKVFQRYGKVDQGELEAGEILFAPSEVARCDNDPSFPENGILVIAVDGGDQATGVGSLP